MTVIDLSHYLQIKSEQIESRLSLLVPENPKASHNRLFQAARHGLLNGGKRLRPILTLATAEVLGGAEKVALTTACAIEMIHTYSLIHDDLPCMDDDDFRRGKPSVHKAFSEAHGVLTGDYLLTYAFQIIAEDECLSAEQKVALIAILAKQAGGDGMIAGQVMDIEAEGKLIDQDHLKHIHRHKTGALITASIVCGGILAKASPAQLKLLGQFGDCIGLAFQIIDDVLDVTASVEKHGKAVSSDEINKKSTYVTLLGLEKARMTANELLNEAHLALDELQIDSSLLRELSKRLVFRNI